MCHIDENSHGGGIVGGKRKAHPERDAPFLVVYVYERSNYFSARYRAVASNAPMMGPATGIQA